jgi:hypothetical protein
MQSHGSGTLGVHLVRSAQPQMSAELDFANIINYKIRDTQFAFYCTSYGSYATKITLY